MCRTPIEWSGRSPPPISRMSNCVSSSGATAAIVFFVVIATIIGVVCICWFVGRKFQHYFPYKRLSAGTAASQGGVGVATTVNMSGLGLDDADDSYAM